MNILREAIAAGQSKVVALCDVDERILERACQEVEKLCGDSPKRYIDYREVLEKEKPEIVINATPDHWHALITIDAVKAGAHVYVEKPISHTIREGRAMVNAARQAGRVVQVGTHRRVSPHNVSGREFIRSGKVGKIGMVRAFVHYGADRKSPARTSSRPKGYTGTCGAARPRCGPITATRKTPGPAASTPAASGIISITPMAPWATGASTGWIRSCGSWTRSGRGACFSVGGRPIKGPPVLTAEEQTSDAPDHQIAVFQFDGFDVSWEHRQFAGNNAEKGESVGCYFYGERGTFHMGWQRGWTFYPVDPRQPVLHEDPQLHKPDDQNIKELWADFLQCIATGKRPVCDIELIYYSTSVALLGMLCYKLGRSIQWDGEKEECVGDPEANKLLRRPYRSPWKYPEA